MHINGIFTKSGRDFTNELIITGKLRSQQISLLRENQIFYVLVNLLKCQKLQNIYPDVTFLRCHQLREKKVILYNTKEKKKNSAT